MAFSFTYSIASDTPFGVLNGGLLRDEIAASTITIATDSVDTLGDVLTVNFKANISAGEESVLDVIVASHNGFLKSQDSSQVQIEVSDDQRVKISENDSTTGFLKDKLQALDNKVSIAPQNDGGNETIQISVNPANIGTSELNNDSNFINSSQAPVQPSDLSDFETSSELNSRDINNRNRANHTGTQAASTISDFGPAVQANETITGLSLNVGTNVLSYTKEDGTTDTADLSPYLDNTNLSQIVSGVLDAVTGICTFTRDDLTTFTVDFSSLNDQAFIGNAISTHEQTIENHDDVSFNSPTEGDILRYNGTNWVNFQTVFEFAVENNGLINQGTSYEQFLRLNFTLNETATIRVSFKFVWSLNSTQNDHDTRIQLDDNQTIFEQIIEPQDSGGAGISLPVVGGGTANTGTNQRFTKTGFDIVENISAGAHFIDLDWRSNATNQEAAIYRAQLVVERLI